MKFKVLSSERALKDLKKLSKIDRKRIYEELEKLEEPCETVKYLIGGYRH